MTNNDNNLGMAGEPGVSESPISTDGGGEGSAATSTTEGLPQEISAEEFGELKAKAAKADENWEKYVRLTADFDNYKKRAARERTESRGAHTRDDHPGTDKELGKVNVVIRRAPDGSMSVTREPLLPWPDDVRALIEEGPAKEAS